MCALEYYYRTRLQNIPTLTLDLSNILIEEKRLQRRLSNIIIECNKLRKYNTTHYHLPQLQYIITSTNPKQEPLINGLFLILYWNLHRYICCFHEQPTALIPWKPHSKQSPMKIDGSNQSTWTLTLQKVHRTADDHDSNDTELTPKDLQFDRKKSLHPPIRNDKNYMKGLN